MVTVGGKLKVELAKLRLVEKPRKLIFVLSTTIRSTALF